MRFSVSATWPYSVRKPSWPMGEAIVCTGGRAGSAAASASDSAGR